MAIKSCCCCGKQIIRSLSPDYPSRYDKCVTKFAGSRFMGPTEGYCCGYCSEDLNEDGLFPEEVALAIGHYGYEERPSFS